MKCTAEQYESIKNDPAYHDLGVLPSQMIPYKGRMEKMFIRPFRLPELRLLSKSAQLQELSHLIRAVDMTISHDVYDLTIGDFYYVLLWLRIHSMPDSPYILEWHCTQPFFKHKETGEALLYSMPNEVWPTMEVLETDYDVSECDTENTSVVNFPSVEVLCLEEDFVLDEELDFPRVSILENLNAAMLDAELCMIAPAIQWLKGDTWADKIKIANEEASLNLLSKAMKTNRTVVHGISETATFMCNKCRIEHTHKLTLNAQTFFQ